MSTSTKVIEAARILVEAAIHASNVDYTLGGRLVPEDEFGALDAALKAYDARRAEMSAMQITGGG